MTRFSFTSESVTEGHPDKLADQVSDAIVDAHLSADPSARVACETAVTAGLLVLLGEITSRAEVDHEAIAREVVADIGYTDPSLGFDAHGAEVRVAIGRQSPDIAQGVDRALEARAHGGDDAQGAGDQGLMFGFACDETPELMPLPITMAHRLTRRLAAVRHDGTLTALKPDGKSQVTVRYEAGAPVAIETIVLSAQHSADVSSEQLEADLRRFVIEPVLRDDFAALGAPTRILVNPTGRFVVGGPTGDAGLTGRKIIVDTYGGMARHGGGAFSGKDPSKVDRSAAYAARHVAKTIVAAGLARRCEVQVSYAIGVAEPTSLLIETFGTATVAQDRLEAAVLRTFDLRPAAIIETLALRHTRYRAVAAYGHMGRPDLDLPWERLDRVEALLRAL